ncbi:MAG: alanine racemase [Pseudomonadota bacterium]
MITARLRVDLDALARNFSCLRSAAERTAAVVKADAYGLGAGPVARRLSAAGCRDFFVATAAEGRALRSVLDSAAPAPRIFVFEGARLDTVDALLEASLTPVLNSYAQLELWRPHRAQPVAVQVDTGMSRLGFDGHAPARLARELAPFRLVLLVGHYACADDPQAVANKQQAAQFQAVRAHLPEVPVSMGNSAATLSDQVETDGMARAGIALYGGRAFVGEVSDRSPLEPVAAFQARVLQLRDVAAGTRAGYGGAWIAQRDSRLAVIGAGYADGLPRALADGGRASWAEQRLPFAGRISMDLATLDVTGTDLAVDDWVTLFGVDPPLAEVADLLQTIDYEVLTGIGARVQRQYGSLAEATVR